MNAAARLVHQNVLSRHLILTQALSRYHRILAALTGLLIFSVLGVIYTSYHTRNLNADYQVLSAEKERLQIEQGQLLLEKSSLLIPAKLQREAEIKLKMVYPKKTSFVMINE